jgi:phosphopantothenoylcysteine decarboxylase/phosphopantothenate--cysteine ligase
LKKVAAMTLELVQNDDILKQISSHRRPGTVVIGFAAETENLRAEARRKLLAKNLDAIVANDVSKADSGFEVDRNAGLFVTHDSEVVLPLSSKRAMAGRILDQLTALRLSRAALVY